jgi:hypothetical protein
VKLIGMELRVASSMLHQKLEAMIVPLDIRFARAENDPYASSVRPEVEVTFHTTDGDVTVRAVLPTNPQDSLIQKDAEACHRFLRAQVER